MNSAEPDEKRFQSFQATLPALLFLTLLFLVNFISRLIFAPLLPVIEDDLGISHASSGSLFLFISIGYFISILLSGFVSSALTHSRTIVLSTITSGVVLMVLSNSNSLLSLRTGLFCLGLCAGLYLPSGIASISQIVAPEYRARGMGVHELAPNIGFIVVPLLSTVLLSWWSWGQSLLVIGAVLVLTGTLYAFSSTVHTGVGTRPSLISFKMILNYSQFWHLVLMFSLAICSTLGLYTMLPLFLVIEGNYELDEANTIIALSRLLSVFMPLLGGWAGDRLGHRAVMLVVLLAGGLITIPMGFTGGNLLLFLVFLQPMIAVCFFPSGFSVLTNLGSEEEANLAVSLCIPAAFLLGGGLIPILIGFVGDHFSLGIGFCLAGFACCGGGLISAYFYHPGTGSSG